MTETLTMVDLALKSLLGVVSLGGIIFAAGKGWSTVSKLLGSQEALHRRMTEQEQERHRRDEQIDAVLMQIRLDIRAIQTWKQTMRFRPPQAEQDMFVVAPEER